MIQVSNSAPTEVLSFVRQNERNKVFVALNFSAKLQTVTFQESSTVPAPSAATRMKIFTLSPSLTRLPSPKLGEGLGVRAYFQESLFYGRYIDCFSGEVIELSGAGPLELKPWGYRVFVK